MSIRPEDWEVLGLEPGADIGQVRRAYRHRRSLYEPAALATYNLLDDEEREDMVVRIDEAYQRIMDSEPAPAPPAPPAPQPIAKPVEETPAPSGNAPNPTTEPGAFLQYQRLTQGFTLHQIAGETKIGVTILEQIESEDFEALPAEAFVRGHVHQFARELRMADSYEFTKLYIAKLRGGDSEEHE